VVKKLKVRTEPNLISATVKVLDMNSKLEIIEVKDQLEIIDNIESRWMRVSISDGESGWVFGGYTRNFDESLPPYSVNDLIGTWECGSGCTSDSGSKCTVSLTFSHDRSVSIPADFCDNTRLDTASINRAIEEKGHWIFNNYNASFSFMSQSGQIISGVIMYSDGGKTLQVNEDMSIKFMRTAE